MIAYDPQLKVFLPFGTLKTVVKEDIQPGKPHACCKKKIYTQLKNTAKLIIYMYSCCV